MVRSYAAAWAILLLGAVPTQSYALDYYFGGSVTTTEPYFEGFEDATGAQAYVGIYNSENIGFELGYIDFGEFDVTNSSAGNSIDISAFNVSMQAQQRLNRWFGCQAKLHGLWYELQPNIAGVNNIDSESGLSVGLTFGLSFYFTDSIKLFADGGYFFDIENVDLQTFSAGFEIRI